MFRGLRKILGICTLKDYLYKDENGITYLEKLLKDGKELDFTQKDKIINSVEAGYIYTKYNKSLFGFKFTEEQLFTKINNEYFIEYLLSKDNCTVDMIEKVKEHTEIIDILIKYNIIQFRRMMWGMEDNFMELIKNEWKQGDKEAFINYLETKHFLKIK